MTIEQKIDMPPEAVFPFVISQDDTGTYTIHTGDIAVMTAIKMRMHGVLTIVGTGNLHIDNACRQIQAGSASWPVRFKEQVPQISLSTYAPAPQDIVEKLVRDYAAGIGYASVVRMNMMLLEE